MLSTSSRQSALWDDDDWTVTPLAGASGLYRAGSVGNSWGVVTSGRGFQWRDKGGSSAPSSPEVPSLSIPKQVDTPPMSRSISADPTRQAASPTLRVPSTSVTPTLAHQTWREPVESASAYAEEPESYESSSHSNVTQIPRKYSSPLHITPFSSRPGSPHPVTPLTPGSVRPRRRSTQKRVSLFAGRVMIEPVRHEPPSILQPSLHRTSNSKGSINSVSSAEAPEPSTPHTFLGTQKIEDFEIEREIGRGAYGIVKRARLLQADGTLGPALVIKQVIKSRILADCWKRHSKYGTIPTEIFVMSRISNTTYVLPARRPWDPSRFSDDAKDSDWVEGTVVKGHPNICPLLDFFEDNHYYYLMLPSIGPEQVLGQGRPPADLFDVVEAHPNGLPPHLVRSYLGQIADALSFLHSLGIAHRDVKDENVILGNDNRCILIDYGSSGMIKSNGWDSFSGTLDYAGPEILRGERYKGKEQDIWAFGVVAFVLLIGECPFMSAEAAQAGLESPFATARIALEDRCGEDHELEGEEADGGGALGDAAELVKACLQVEVDQRPSIETIITSTFLWGKSTPSL